LAACLALTALPGAARQQPPATAAAASQAARPKPAAAVQWVAGLDTAMKRMGADSRPVILYFTYDT
jgi:hypothetical protein